MAAKPGTAGAALLLIDFINDFEFEDAERIFPAALQAARTVAALKERARAAGLPIVYANDNFGRWRSDFRSLLRHCLEDGVRGRPIAELLKPGPDDYFVLKPRHSAFQSTPLELLLERLRCGSLILTGVAGDMCVLFTANDAYMRNFRLLVPADCIASLSSEDNRRALDHMAKVCKADTRPSAQIDLAALAG